MRALGCDDTRDADADGDGDGDGSNNGGGSGIHRSNTQHVVAARHSGTAAVPSLLRDNVPYRMFWCTIRWRNSSLHVRTLAPDNLGLGGSEQRSKSQLVLYVAETGCWEEKETRKYLSNVVQV